MESNQDQSNTGSTSVDPDQLIGTLVDDRYLIDARLARGGMAVVYRAIDKRLDRPVALKIMHPHLAESPQFNTRFRREARAAARISHAGVVPVYDQGEIGGRGYLVMELIEGSNLRSVLNSNKRLTLADAFSYCARILEALSAAHAVGVVHRDIKPENVLITDGGATKVVDFGLARAVSDVSLSATGSIFGTVAYLAPEVAQSGIADQRTDIYATGLILFEMLTGRLPWPNEVPLQSAYWRVHNDLPAPSSLVDWLPTEIDDLIFALCARNPQDRPQTASDALILLEKTKQTLPEPLLGQDLPLPDKETVELSGTRSIAALGKTAVIQTPKVVVHTSNEGVRGGAEEPRRSKKVPAVVLTIVLLLGAIGAGIWWWAEYGPGSYKEVPSLAGETKKSAEQTLEELGFISNFKEEYSDTVPQGVVIETQPKAGMQIHKDEELAVIISAGIKTLTIPDLQGKPIAEAKGLLGNAGFSNVQIEEVYSEDVPEGQVVQLSPHPGKIIAHNEKLTVEVSKGREPIAIPNLVGSETSRAQQILEDAGLKAVVSEEYSDTVPEGQVISQNPMPDASVLYRGDSVEIVSSLGPELVEVPAVRGMAIENAETKLKEAGFEVEIQRIADLLGLVGSQSPGGGELARKGSVVTLNVV